MSQSHEKIPGAKLKEIIEVIRQVSDVVKDHLGLLTPAKKHWQPCDIIPDLTKDNWHEIISQMREDAKVLSDRLLVILVGNMITEEGLPSYQTMLNRYEGAKDETGVDDHPWALWTRGWTAEENRHGDLLNRYLYLTGRVNMRSVEVTIHNLLKNGFNMRTDGHHYKALIYTSFQERATKMGHQNIARLAKEQGDPTLYKICNIISTDEAKHEKVYKTVMGKIFEIDPEESLLAFEQIMRQTVVMPMSLMDDEEDPKLFHHFSIVSNKLGTYTNMDYANMVDYFLDLWHVRELKNISTRAAEAQEKVCSLVERYQKLAEKTHDRIMRQPDKPFSWIFNRTA